MTIPLDWALPRSKLRRMDAGELLQQAQTAEHWEIKARIAGDTYGEQVAKENRHLAERTYCEKLMAAAA